MPRVATFCPRCGESIDTQLPEEARTAGRAELTCPSCRFRFVIAPASPSSGPARSQEAGPVPGDAERAPSDEPSPPPSEQTSPAGAASQAAPDAATPSPDPMPRATQAHAAGKGPSGALPARLLSAALLLFFAAAVGLFFAFLFASAPGIFEDQLDGPPGSGELEGVVVGPDRSGMEGVTVALMAPVDEGRPDAGTESVAEATSDEEGRFVFENIDPGERWLRVDHEGHRLTFFQVWVFSAEDGPSQPGFGAALWEVSLRAGDSEEPVYQTQQVEMLGVMLQVFQVLGWVAVPASVVAGIGGVFILLRRSFPMAVVGCVAGIVAVGFLIGLLLAVIALILVLTARQEFAPRGEDKPDETGAS